MATQEQARRAAATAPSVGGDVVWIFVVISNEGREKSFASARDAKNYLHKTLKRKGRVERRMKD